MTDTERIDKLERKVKALEEYVERVAPLIKALTRPPSQAERDATNLLGKSMDLHERIRNLTQRKP